MGLLGNEVRAGIIQGLPQGSQKGREIQIPRLEAWLLGEGDRELGGAGSCVLAPFSWALIPKIG